MYTYIPGHHVSLSHRDSDMFHAHNNLLHSWHDISMTIPMCTSIKKNRDMKATHTLDRQTDKRRTDF